METLTKNCHACHAPAAVPPEADFVHLDRARTFIEHNYFSNPPLPSIAAAAGLSMFHFHRRFTSRFAETPKAFVDRLRIDRAKQLLASGHRVADVVRAMSYLSTSNFTRRFTRAVGMTPGRWKRTAARSP
jgi:AraC family transcriptional regulator